MTAMRGIIHHMQIDHVLLATDDLEAGDRLLASAHGLTTTGGGRHEGIGTHNRIVPLGRGYLELIAVHDPQEAASSPLGSVLAAAIAERAGRFLGWCVAVEDVEAVSRRLGTEISQIARAGLTARLTGVAEAMAEPTLPFFIERHDDARGAGIDAIEVSGDAVRLGEWLGGASLPVSVAAGAPGVLAVTVGGHTLT
jgi:hypothetical protein